MPTRSTVQRALLALLRYDRVRTVGTGATLVGALLIFIGILLGWGGLAVRWAGISLPGVAYLLTPLTSSEKVEIGTFLGADLTTLAVIIAIVIGFNASLLQVAGRSVSLALTRAILFSISPYLVCWGAITTVTLAYLVNPPIYRGQVPQLFAWFGAVVLLMLGYLLLIPWRLSGEFAASWALQNLRHQPIARWEMMDGYSVVQTSFNSATALGDLGAARALTLALGSFLVTQVDPQAEQDNHYTSERFRALKNLITGFAPNVATSPTQVAYYVGILCAATLVQAAAVSAVVDDKGRHLFSGVLRALRASPERLDPFWSGVRHALCKQDIQGEPYLASYWRSRHSWASTDARLIKSIAEGVMELYKSVWQTAKKNQLATAQSTSMSRALAGMLQSDVPNPSETSDDEEEVVDATDLLKALLRNVGGLGTSIAAEDPLNLSHILDYPSQLLDTLHELAVQYCQTPTGQDVDQAEIQKTYDEQRSALANTTVSSVMVSSD